MVNATELAGIIAAINPSLYYDGTPSEIAKFKELRRNKGFSDAVSESIGKGKPLVSFSLLYDSPSSELEPIYFYLLDFLAGFTKGEKGIDKITDNFNASPGSGHF